MFTGLYPFFKWCFLIGTLVALLFYSRQKIGRKHGTKIRQALKVRLNRPLFVIVDFPVLKPLKLLNWFNPILFVAGFQGWAAPNLAFWTIGFYLSFIFMHYIKRRYTAFWEKYTYVLAAALYAGVALSAVIMFFAVEYNARPLNWWGNEISHAGVDAQNNRGFLSIPEVDYFGCAPGHFP